MPSANTAFARGLGAEARWVPRGSFLLLSRQCAQEFSGWQGDFAGEDVVGGMGSGATLVGAIQDYLYFQRAMLIKQHAFEHIHEMTAFRGLWKLFPSPFYSPYNDIHWQACLRAAVRACHAAAQVLPGDTAFRQRPDRGATDIARCGKRLGILVLLMLRLIPYAECVDYDMWPSPFDLHVSKRAWESSCQHVRDALRMLKFVPDHQIERVEFHEDTVEEDASGGSGRFSQDVMASLPCAVLLL